MSKELCYIYNIDNVYPCMRRTYVLKLRVLLLFVLLFLFSNACRENKYLGGRPRHMWNTKMRIILELINVDQRTFSS